MDSKYNPNGSNHAIEGITSRNGQIIGKMGHSERYEDGLSKIFQVRKTKGSLFQQFAILQENNYDIRS